jgi:hypothetical protein
MAWAPGIGNLDVAAATVYHLGVPQPRSRVARLRSYPNRNSGTTGGFDWTSDRIPGYFFSPWEFESPQHHLLRTSAATR